MSKDQSNGKWLNNIGRIIKKKDKPDGTPGGFFLVFERRRDKNKQYIGESPFPLTVNEGDIFQLKAKKDDIANLVKDGKLTQEQANEICKVVRFEISKAPAHSQADVKAETPQTDDEVNF